MHYLVNTHTDTRIRVHIPSYINTYFPEISYNFNKQTTAKILEEINEILQQIDKINEEDSITNKFNIQKDSKQYDYLVTKLIIKKYIIELFKRQLRAMKDEIYVGDQTFHKNNVWIIKSD